MKLITTYAIISYLLIPVNLFCAYWIFRVLFGLSSTTLRKMIEDLADEQTFSGRLGLRRRQRIILRYLSERSCDPRKTDILFRCYIKTTVLSGLIKILMDGMIFSENPYKLQIAVAGILIFMAVDIAFLWFGIRYRKTYLMLDKDKNDHPR